MTAVLDRPHALASQPTRPAQRGQLTARVRGHRPRRQHAPSRGVQRGQRVRPLVRVGPDHDHEHRPFVGLTSDDRTAGRTHLSGGDATLLSGHAGAPRAAADDTTLAGQTPDRQQRYESVRRRPENLRIAGQPPTSATPTLSLRLRYRLLHIAGRLTRPATPPVGRPSRLLPTPAPLPRHARRLTLHLPADWPWTAAVAKAFKRLA